ncbi:Bax inhibitor-1 family protein [Salmonella enterica]|nr:hypothetical protein [Salmonella enterica subsp. enterica serovar Coleypark]ECI2454611.1 hypothetical protein [Salmonella enterica subsp. enterica serovar Coleypark]EDU1089530.1 hypothetical protein [Salmonella enterica subsp. enterica serovar Coleypark]EDV0318917.1 hypothetical protein [Salmonella enterica subsp. enterica serovar Coleypark]EHI6295332.1 hypothetical protein [Salmonella enterica]
MSFQPSFAGPQPDSRIDRTTFIRRAYLHLAVAIVGFIVLSAAWSFIGVGEYALDVLLCAGFILYDTSNIIHHYPTDRPAGAALHLFASIATMFWYILRIFMSRN